MHISRGQWLLAWLAALVAHLLVFACFWFGRLPADAPRETPRGVMVSLDTLEAGPPPAASTPTAPAEAPEPASAVPEAAPEVAAAPAPTPTESASPSAPEPATAVGPDPAPAPAEASQPGAPSVAATDTGAPSAVVPSQATPVEIRPSDTLESVAPTEQVTARTPEAATPPSANTEAPGNGAGGTSEAATDDYIVRLRAWLSRHKQYPDAARRDEVEGTVRLYLVVNQDGHVISHRIAQSSGSAALDAAVERMLERAEPLPSMPAAMQRNRLELIVPVVFTLR